MKAWRGLRESVGGDAAAMMPQRIGQFAAGSARKRGTERSANGLAVLRQRSRCTKAETVDDPKGMMIEGIECLMPGEVKNELLSLVQSPDNMYGMVVDDLPTVVALGRAG